MKHKQFEEWLQLYLYDELSDQERTLFEHHLSDCDKCRMDIDEMKKFRTALAHHKPFKVEEPILQEARRNLRLRIHAIATKESFLDRAKELLDGFLAPSYQMALGGISILAVGVTVGYFVFGSPTGKSPLLRSISSVSAVEAGESQVSNIRFLERNTHTGDVEFTFETTTPVHVRGNVNDEQIQKVLARALVNEQNAGIRLNALNIIGSHSERGLAGNAELNSEVKSSLIKALLNDRNLGVRKEALDVLKKYLPDPAIVRAFLTVLANEKNTGLKIAAINSLDLTKYENQPLNQEILDMFRQKARSDENNYIRIKAKAALQEVQQ